MQAMLLNKRTIHYALFVSDTDYIVDGQKTGEKVKTYTVPVELRANVSAARGTADTEQFGINEDYEKTVVVADPNCPIQEDSILWVDTPPDNNSPHDYIVKRVARSINSVMYAIKKVKVR